MREPGLIAPLVTPLTPDGAVSEACVRAQVARVRPYVRALMPGISCGEGWLLDRPRWERLAAAVLDCRDGLPVHLGVQAADTAEVIRRARWAVRHGADAVTVGPPHGAGARQRAVHEHFARVCAAVDTPVCVYHESVVSGTRMTPATLTAVCRLDGVRAVKESGREPSVTNDLIAAVPDVAVHQGWEDLFHATPGAAGLIGPLVLIDPALCAELVAGVGGVQGVVTDRCRELGLFRPDYVARTKRELCRLGVLAHAVTL
uniref:Dihydrodipicolinate synthetase family protein n=1 Tax=Streptomyces rimofaciens TaxID=504097 RepID=H9BDX3_9ACTN|nr:dihydrodipicolinate synthetase family protein [Streptomyces rimofaciens]